MPRHRVRPFFRIHFHGVYLFKTFEQVLQHADLPEPGPAYYQARRRLWLTPRKDLAPRLTPSLAQKKLEAMLNQPNAIHSIQAWNNGLERVWQGLCSGGKLKTFLPMSLIVCNHHTLSLHILHLHKIKIVHASWLQDGTWPAGMEAPSSDDQTERQGTSGSTSDPPEHIQPIRSISSTDIVESRTSPWMVAKQYHFDRWR